MRKPLVICSSRRHWFRMHAEIPLDPEARGKIDYARLREHWQALAAGESDPIARMASFAALVYHADARFSWVGFYRAIEPELLVIGPYQGPPGCLRIAFGRGVCGTAAATGEIQLVPDVHVFPGHIACDARARSELVIPMFGPDGRVTAVLDLDSHVPDAFTSEDARELVDLLSDWPDEG